MSLVLVKFFDLFFICFWLKSRVAFLFHSLHQKEFKNAGQFKIFLMLYSFYSWVDIPDLREIYFQFMVQ